MSEPVRVRRIDALLYAADFAAVLWDEIDIRTMLPDYGIEAVSMPAESHHGEQPGPFQQMHVYLSEAGWRQLDGDHRSHAVTRPLALSVGAFFGFRLAEAIDAARDPDNGLDDDDWAFEKLIDLMRARIESASIDDPRAAAGLREALRCYMRSCRPQRLERRRDRARRRLLREELLREVAP